MATDTGTVLTPPYGTDWVSEMLQQMAAESTGTAAPIHLQGEPMATAPAPNLDAVPGHNWWVTTSHNDGRMDQWAECECGWRGTKHRVSVNLGARPPAHADGLAHAAQFKAPEPEQPMPDPAMEHLRLYQAKRAEWLQAKHDAEVADKALDVQRAKAIEARRAMRLAEAVADKAAQHRDEQRAIAENLDGELWALVKGEQA